MATAIAVRRRRRDAADFLRLPAVQICRNPGACAVTFNNGVVLPLRCDFRSSLRYNKAVRKNSSPGTETKTGDPDVGKR